MIIEKKRDAEHLIQNLTRTSSAMEYSFSWKFQNASHFLIAVMEGTEEMRLEEDILTVLRERADELISTKNLEERGLQLSLVTEQKFRLDRNRYAVSRQKLKAQTPYQVAVYACELKGECLEVYESKNEENRSSVPVTLIGKVRYKTPLFSRQTICLLNVPRVPGYADGMIIYKPSCSRCTFPLAESCLGRETAVMLPKGETVTLLMAEAYRPFYTIKIEEG